MTHPGQQARVPHAAEKREHGVPTPLSEALQVLANRAAAGRLPPGSVTAGEILAAAAG